MRDHAHRESYKLEMPYGLDDSNMTALGGMSSLSENPDEAPQIRPHVSDFFECLPAIRALPEHGYGGDDLPLHLAYTARPDAQKMVEANVKIKVESAVEDVLKEKEVLALHLTDFTQPQFDKFNFTLHTLSSRIAEVNPINEHTYDECRVAAAPVIKAFLEARPNTRQPCVPYEELSAAMGLSLLRQTPVNAVENRNRSSFRKFEAIAARLNFHCRFDDEGEIANSFYIPRKFKFDRTMSKSEFKLLRETISPGGAYVVLRNLYPGLVGTQVAGLFVTLCNPHSQAIAELEGEKDTSEKSIEVDRALTRLVAEQAIYDFTVANTTSKEQCKTKIKECFSTLLKGGQPVFAGPAGMSLLVSERFYLARMVEFLAFEALEGCGGFCGARSGSTTKHQMLKARAVAANTGRFKSFLMGDVTAQDSNINNFSDALTDEFLLQICGSECFVQSYRKIWRFCESKKICAYSVGIRAKSRNQLHSGEDHTLIRNTLESSMIIVFLSVVDFELCLNPFSHFVKHGFPLKPTWRIRKELLSFLVTGDDSLVFLSTPQKDMGEIMRFCAPWRVLKLETSDRLGTFCHWNISLEGPPTLSPLRYLVKFCGRTYPQIAFDHLLPLIVAQQRSVSEVICEIASNLEASLANDCILYGLPVTGAENFYECLTSVAYVSPVAIARELRKYKVTTPF